MEEALIKANEPELVSAIPDIGMIRNERKYQIETFNKSKGETWLFAGLYTKRDAMKVFEKRKRKDLSIRVWHMGVTPEGVPIKIVSVSFRWNVKDRR